MAISDETQIIGPPPPPPPDLVDADFTLARTAKTPEKREAALDQLHRYLTYYQDHFLGYQVNQGITSLEGDLARFLGVHTNNIGDPFHDTNLKTHTKVLERAVLAYYAELWGLEPHNINDETQKGTGWGYVLSMGSSEGNIYGLLNARDYLSGKFLMTSKTDAGTVKTVVHQGEYDVEDHLADPATQPVAFFSEDTHYSVAKAAHTLSIPTFGELGARLKYTCPVPGEWPTEVPSNFDGTIDVGALKTFVRFFVDQGHPVLIVLNLGSTFRGAHDHVPEVVDALAEFFHTVSLEVGDHYEDRNNYWIHIDGALGASYLPFLRMAREPLAEAEEVPEFDFRVDEVCSIVTSGHKYPGAPWACGIYMTRSELQLKPPQAAEYVNSPDTTFGGSRNAFSSIVLWNHLAQNSYESQMKTIAGCMDVAHYTTEQLSLAVKKHPQPGHRDLVTRSPNALSIVFPRPNDYIVKEFSLAVVTVESTNPDYTVQKAHMFVMPHVTRDRIDDLVKELDRQTDPFPSTEQLKKEIDVTLPAPVPEVLHLSADRGFS